MVEYKEGNFSRHVEGMEDLPPPDPNNLGKLPNVKRYPYLPRLPHPRYLNHTVDANGSLNHGDEEDEDEGMEDEDDKDEIEEEEEDDKDEEEEDDDDEEEHSNVEEDEMVSDEEMEDNDSVIEDNLPDRGLPPPDGP
ncbi:hypothetical protein FHG87_016805 [Trinorchestia longiramus]|nr:hypothetical protein FHG87_016805 [Trinorchestia longiramus]